MSFTPNQYNELVIRTLFPEETPYNQFISKITEKFPIKCNGEVFQHKLHAMLIDILHNNEEGATIDSIIEKLNTEGGHRRSSKKNPTARRRRSSKARKARQSRKSRTTRRR